MSTRYIIPDKVEIEASDGKPRMLSNDEIDVAYVYAALMARKQQSYIGCFEPREPIRENAICTRGMMVLMDIALYFNRTKVCNKGAINYIIYYDDRDNEFRVIGSRFIRYSPLWFKNRKDAETVVKNPNFRKFLYEAFNINNEKY